MHLTVQLWEYVPEDSGGSSWVRLRGEGVEVGAGGQWMSEIKQEKEQNPGDNSHFILLPFLPFNWVHMA